VSPSLRTKLNSLVERFQRLTELLMDESVINNVDKLRETSKEQADLRPVAELWDQYVALEEELEQIAELHQSDDAEMRQMAIDEELNIKAKFETIEEQLKQLLIPKDPHDESNIFLEIRAGTGGNEAALFVGTLYLMYQRYAESMRWKIEVLNLSDGEVGGFKEVILRIVGKGAYSYLKFESGAHRVQRVPETESQGRVHTSACTVAVMPEVTADEEIDINPQDLRIDTFRSSGAGGQHVNKTDSAIRITHLPTGVVVECQEGRSQHQNKAKALTMLHSRLLDERLRKHNAEQSAQRKSLVGSGDRSDRIRTYNFPQGRVTDHRINLTEYKLEQILGGDMHIVIDPLRHEHQAELMSQLQE
jgi:peptide chain release factor 1